MKKQVFQEISLFKHSSADPSHYNSAAENYDAFNEENSQMLNGIIERILQKHHVKTVLD